jgi:hypothetical protein
MSLSGLHIVIIDFADAYELGKSLTRAGATVHIVSRGGALMLARNKRIDAAFVNFGVGEDTRLLCEQLTALGVRQIITTPGNVGSAQQTANREVLPKLAFSLARIAKREEPSCLH